jgi:GNAT superfamily N-acetyltransferase
MTSLIFEAATPEHSAALTALFTRTGTGCHCQYWHFAGDKNAWLDRLAHAPQENRDAFLKQLSERPVNGVVALHDGRAVGWMKICPAIDVAKLYAQRVYRGLPCFTGEREGVFTIGCILVDEEFRRQGIARALVRFGIGCARTAGARALEAFPRRSDSAGPAELWTGPFSVFFEAGFQVVNDFGPYPVLRYDLRDKPARSSGIAG